jgi:hypothetical protein
MMFIKRLFSREKKAAEDPLRGVEVHQTRSEQDATRKHMESEMAADREHRGAKDVRPGSEEPPASDA